ncbi:hypothetical protein RHMOL_Rhmol04G0242300 [Rhododendron molle]|uniref:Uncharacterized protein n=1 Tax=Rhododendron molle TaxID=49168 RepID=A0ACC0P5K2_RHOML|nr:hypothetical protein RHMOL_Rhmol04G0242300 [Rhododendron molle]
MAKNRRPRIRFACEWIGKYRSFINKAKDKRGNVKENGKEPKAKKMACVTGTKKCECPFELRCVKGLEDKGYIEFHQKDDNDCVKDLLWSHLTSGNMLRAFPQVLLMDCTYRTNRYRFPLLQIVGVTSTEKTFSAAFAFIDRKKEENYTWMLKNLKSMMDLDALLNVILTDRELALVNVITRVFPTANHLLCWCHIGQNVFAKCRKMSDEVTWALFKHAWDSLMYLSTISLYEQTLCKLKRDFVLYPSTIQYVKTNWLVPYRQTFVSGWTNNVMQFGNLTSNR